MFHEGEGNTRVVTGDGVAKGRDIFFFNVIHDRVTKGSTDIAEDVVFVGGEAM